MYLERIKELRESENLTQNEMAVLLKIKQQTYNNYELGKMKIPIKIIMALAKYYCTSIDYIVGITNQRTPYKKKRHIK